MRIISIFWFGKGFVSWKTWMKYFKQYSLSFVSQNYKNDKTGRWNKQNYNQKCNDNFHLIFFTFQIRWRNSRRFIIVWAWKWFWRCGRFRYNFNGHFSRDIFSVSSFIPSPIFFQFTKPITGVFNSRGINCNRTNIIVIIT